MAVAADWERPDKVVGWRFDILYRAGYKLEDARDLARKPWVDLHAAVQLVERGCDPMIARRIVL